MKVAIVHERFTEMGGSENVVEQLGLEFENARLFIPIYDPESLSAQLAPRTTGLWPNRLYQHPLLHRHAPLMPLFPLALRQIRQLKYADVVIISHHSFALAAAHSSTAPTVAYVHSPARWAWDSSLRLGEAEGFAGRVALELLSQEARNVELTAAHRVTTVVANSSTVQKRIQDWWRRASVVVHPPVDTEAFTPEPSVNREDFFLVAGRLVPYKRPDIAIRAARRAGVRVVVAGSGRFEQECRKVAAPDTVFTGRISHDELVRLHRTCRALIMPGIEDFGIVPVEAMACGTPVIARGQGGALDTVVPGVSGAFFDGADDEEVVEQLAATITAFRGSDYDPTVIRQHAEGFSNATFRSKMHALIDGAAHGRGR